MLRKKGVTELHTSLAKAPRRGARPLLLLALVLAVTPLAMAATGRVKAMFAASGEIQRIVIPSIEVDSRVVEIKRIEKDGKRQWEVANYAAGHHEGSGAPGGGSNIVISGHNNINGEVFRRLDELNPGDKITLYTRDGEAHDYRVESSRTPLHEGASAEQRAANARYMRPTPSERLTLISCWPYQSDPPYRIIVVAEPE
jgi:sortase A